MRFCTMKIKPVKTLLLLSTITIAFHVTAQVAPTKADTSKNKSSNAMPGLQSKVPRLLVEPPPDSLRRVARINPCSQPHGIFIIDEQEVPCDSILTLKADNIEDIRVLSISETHELYGNRGDPYGALVLITKSYAQHLREKEQSTNQNKKP